MHICIHERETNFILNDFKHFWVLTVQQISLKKIVNAKYSYIFVNTFYGFSTIRCVEQANETTNLIQKK